MCCLSAACAESLAPCALCTSDWQNVKAQFCKHARTHAGTHKRGVIYSASKTRKCRHNGASNPRCAGGPTRHLLSAKRTTCFDRSPVQSGRLLTNTSNKRSSLRLMVARTDALSACSSGHSLLRNNMSQSGSKQKTNRSRNKRGTESNVKFAATHRVITLRKSSVFRPLVFKCLPRSRPLRRGSTSVGE